MPIDDMGGRIRQARQIIALRGVPVAPFTADEIATMRGHLTEGMPQDREAALARLATLPDDMKIQVDASAVTDGMPTDQRSDIQFDAEAGNGSAASRNPNIILAADTPRPLVSAEQDDPLVSDGQIAQAKPAGKKSPTTPAQNKPAVRSQPTPAPIASSTPKTRSGDRPPRTPEEVIPAMEARAKEWAEIVKAPPVITERGQKLLPDDWENTIDKINSNYSKWTREAAQRYGIPPLLLARMLYKETGYNATAVNPRTGARGIAQLFPGALQSIKKIQILSTISTRRLRSKQVQHTLPGTTTGTRTGRNRSLRTTWE